MPYIFYFILLFFPIWLVSLIGGEILASKNYFPKFTKWWRDNVIMENQDWD